MKIGFDAEIFYRQQSGGISLHFGSLITELLKKKHSVSLFCPRCMFADFHRNLYIYSLLGREAISIIYYDSILSLPRLTSSAGIAVFHCTYYSWRPPLQGIPVVRTFHDIAFMRHPLSSNFFVSLFRFLCQTSAFLSCDGVVCVSDFSRSEFQAVFGRLRRFLGFPPAFVQTVRNSSGLEGFSWPDGDQVNLAPRANAVFHLNILYIGLRGGYKNFKNGMAALLKAVSFFQCKDAEVTFRLRVVSKLPLSTQELLQFEQMNIAVECFANVDASALAALYLTSSLLLHPSTYEGFGITVLEAMRLGCPVLAVDIPAIREVAADTIFYSPNGSVDSLALSLKALFLMSSAMFSKSHLASRRASLFSWYQSATALEEFYLRLSAKYC